MIWLSSFRGQLFSADSADLSDEYQVEPSCSSPVSSYLSLFFSLCAQLGFVKLSLHFCVFFFLNIQVSHLFTRYVLDIWLFVAFRTFLLLPLRILYVWITGLDSQLHATYRAEIWGQEAHDASMKTPERSMKGNLKAVILTVVSKSLLISWCS